MKKETAIENLRIFFGVRGKGIFESCCDQLEDKIGFLSNRDNVVFDDHIDYPIIIDIITQNRKSIEPRIGEHHMCWTEFTELLDDYENANGEDNDIVVKGKIEFLEEEIKAYSREFTATLGESGGFSYGNGTRVSIQFHNKKYIDHLIDTRYVAGITKDFKKWLREWFKNNYREHELTLY